MEPGRARRRSGGRCRATPPHAQHVEIHAGVLMVAALVARRRQRVPRWAAPRDVRRVGGGDGRGALACGERDDGMERDGAAVRVLCAGLRLERRRQMAHATRRRDDTRGDRCAGGRLDERGGGGAEVGDPGRGDRRNGQLWRRWRARGRGGAHGCGRTWRKPRSRGGAVADCHAHGEWHRCHGDAAGDQIPRGRPWPTQFTDQP